MANMQYDVVNNVLEIHVDAQLYNEDVLFKCFYWYGKRFSVDITRNDVNTFLVNIKPLINDATHSEDWPSVVTKIKQDLIDFKLRDIVTKETKTIRELITAKAFAYYEPQQNPISEISDPLGFLPDN